MTEYFVKPNLPTILGSQLYHELLPLDLVFAISVETVHVVPGEIDTKRFVNAVSRALSVYPLAAGRFEQPNDTKEKWKIRLTNSAIPVKFLESETEAVMPTDHVIQNKGVFALVDRVDIAKILERDSDEPLARIRLTKFVKLGVTAIGFSQHHSIGDGITVLNFLRLVSQIYQGLPPLDPSPSYTYSFPGPDTQSAKYPESSLVTFHLESPFVVGSPPPIMGKFRGKLTRADCYFSASVIKGVHEAVTSLADRNKGKREEERIMFSKQDTLIALLARTLTKTDPKNPVQYILNLFMYRGIGRTPLNAVCNANLGPITDKFNVDSSHESIESIAKYVRRSVNRSRDRDYLEPLMAKSGRLVEEAAYEGMTMDVAPTNGMMDVNSTWRFDWTSAHFGYPSQTQFYHTTLEEQRWIKIVSPNPTRADDDIWKQYPGAAEVTLHVLKEHQTSFKHSLYEELGALGVGEKPLITFSAVEA